MSIKVTNLLKGALVSSILLSQISPIIVLASEEDEEINLENDYELYTQDDVNDLVGVDVEVEDKNTVDLDSEADIENEEDMLNLTEFPTTADIEQNSEDYPEHLHDETVEVSLKIIPMEEANKLDVIEISPFGKENIMPYEFNLTEEYHLFIEDTYDPSFTSVYFSKYEEIDGYDWYVYGDDITIKTNTVYNFTVEGEDFYIQVTHPDNLLYGETEAFNIDLADESLVSDEDIQSLRPNAERPSYETIWVFEDDEILYMDYVNYSDWLGDYVSVGIWKEIEYDKLYQFTDNRNGNIEYFIVEKEKSDSPVKNEDSFDDSDNTNTESVKIEERLRYTTHVQSYGWMEDVSEGEMSGTSGEAKRLESIRIATDIPGLEIEYTTHVQKQGWTDWVSDYQDSGTTGLGRRLEAIKIELSGEQAANYDIYYRVHAQSYGWLDWAMNGGAAGTEGLAKRLEAIEIVLVDKYDAAPGSTYRPFVQKYTAPVVEYSTHVQSHGWMKPVSNGQLSGTSGESKRMEAIKIDIKGDENLDIWYRTHVQKEGWQDWVSNNEISGTSDKGLRLEAIQINLDGFDYYNHDIYYRVHAESYGWLDWAMNGETAGTEGLGKRLEAIEIVIVERGNKAPGKTDKPFVVIEPSIEYSTHVQSHGWQGWKANGELSGTHGERKRLEAIRAKVSDSIYEGSVEYRTHVQGYGWQDWKTDGDLSGTSGEAKRLEAIQLRLTDELSGFYDIYYRVHAEHYGWLDWAKNGQYAGTEGHGRRLESIEIKLVKKGLKAPGNVLRPFVKKSIDGSISDRPIAYVNFEHIDYGYGDSEIAFYIYADNVSEYQVVNGPKVSQGSANDDLNYSNSNYWIEDGKMDGRDFLFMLDNHEIDSHLQIMLVNKNGHVVKYNYPINEKFVDQVKNNNKIYISEFKGQAYYNELDVFIKNVENLSKYENNLRTEKEIREAIEAFVSLGTINTDSFAVYGIILDIFSLHDGPLMNIHKTITEAIYKLNNEKLLLDYVNELGLAIRDYPYYNEFVDEVRFDNTIESATNKLSRINTAIWDYYFSEEDYQGLAIIDGILMTVETERQYLLEDDMSSEEVKQEKLKELESLVSEIAHFDVLQFIKGSHDLFYIQSSLEDYQDKDEMNQVMYEIYNTLQDNGYDVMSIDYYEEFLILAYSNDAELQ